MGHSISLRHAAATATALIAAPLSAQVTTDCSTMGQYTNCQTYGLPAGPNPAQVMLNNLLQHNAEIERQNEAAFQARKAAEAQAQADAEERQREAANDERAERLAAIQAQGPLRIDRAARAAALVNAGKCAEAHQLVLGEGDPGMAAQVDRLCAAK